MPQADPPAADGGGDAAEADAEPDDEKSVEVMKLRRKQSMLGTEKAASTVEGVLRASLEKLCMDILQKHYEDADPDEEEMDEAESAYRAEQKQRGRQWVERFSRVRRVSAMARLTPQSRYRLLRPQSQCEPPPGSPVEAPARRINMPGSSGSVSPSTSICGSSAQSVARK